MSDIHGNLTALRAVQLSLPPHDQVMVAGDLCLEGPRPAEVLDALQEWGWSLIVGNTDRDIVEGPAGLKEEKASLVAWTREKLGPVRLRLLAELPFQLRDSDGDEDLLVVHANPLNLEDQLHPTMTEKELRPYLDGINASMLAFGHLHIPYVRPVGGVLLMDVSSVGHPKDRDLRAAYTVVSWDREGRKVTQVRIPYDVKETVHQLQQSDMPGADKQAASLLKASY
jgi:predicted phosphodiesterase